MFSRFLLSGLSAAVLLAAPLDLQAQTGAYDLDIGGNGNSDNNVTLASGGFATGVFTSTDANASLSLTRLQSVLTPFNGSGGTAKVQTGAGGGGAGDLRLQVDLLSNGDNASLELRAARDVILNAQLGLSGNQSALLISAGRDIVGNSLISTANGHGQQHYSGTITLQAGGSIRVGEVNSQPYSIFGTGGALILQAGGNVTATALITGTFASKAGPGNVTVAASGAIDIGKIWAYANGGTAGFGGVVNLTAGSDVRTGDILTFSNSTNFTGGAFSGGNVTVTTATGNITTGNISTYSRGFANSPDVRGGNVTLTASAGDITVNGQIDATSLKYYPSGSVSLSTGSGRALSVGGITAGAITLTADAMTFGGGANSIAGVNPTGIAPTPITIQTATASRDIYLGGNTPAGPGVLQITSAGLAALAPGFSQINIGASGRSGAITVDANGANFKSDVRFYQRLGAEGAVDIVTGKTATFSAAVTGTGPRAAFTGGGNFVMADRFTPNNADNGVEAFVVTGSLSFNSPTVLELTLDGASLGQYDRLEISGALALNGTLEVALGDGFNPTPGEVFQVLTFGSATGDFSSLDLPTLADGLSWQVSRDAGAYTLGVVPELSTVSLLALAGVILAGATRMQRRKAAPLNSR